MGGLVERRRPPPRFHEGHDGGVWCDGKAEGTAQAEVLIHQRAWCHGGKTEKYTCIFDPLTHRVKCTLKYQSLSHSD